MKKVFLSYCSADRSLAEAVLERLREIGVPVWFDGFEIRPGDHLEERIRDGIDGCDTVVVLVTPNSAASQWVAKEVAMARAASHQLIPAVLDGVSLPEELTDIVRIGIDKEGHLQRDIVPALFRDSYCVKMKLTEDGFLPNDQDVRAHLLEYMRQETDSFRVHFDARDFGRKIGDVVDSTLVSESPQQVKSHVRQVWTETMPLLTLYWSNLAELVSELVNANTQDFGKRADELDTIVPSVVSTIRMSHRRLGRRLSHVILPSESNSSKDPEVVGFANQFCQPQVPSDGAVAADCRLSKTLWYGPHPEKLVRVDVVGKRADRISDASFYLPVLLDNDATPLRFGSTPEQEIMPHVWYVACLPQILSDCVWTATFRLGCPVWELDSLPGLRMCDYERIGLH